MTAYIHLITKGSHFLLHLHPRLFTLYSSTTLTFPFSRSFLPPSPASTTSAWQQGSLSFKKKNKTSNSSYWLAVVGRCARVGIHSWERERYPRETRDRQREKRHHSQQSVNVDDELSGLETEQFADNGAGGLLSGSRSTTNQILYARRQGDW